MTEIKLHNLEKLKLEQDYGQDITLTLKGKEITVTATIPADEFWKWALTALKEITEEWHNPSFTTEKGL